MKPILYSTGCPLCVVLKTKLIGANIDFEEVNDVRVMEQVGLFTAPGLDVDGELLSFREAVDWVNGVEK